MAPIIKLIAVDMDGTLLRSDKMVDPETASDIQAALDRGIRTAYCTGRGVAEMRDIFPLLPMIRFAVCSSGAVIWDREEERCLYTDGIRQSYIDRIVDTALKYGAMPHFLTERESVAAAADVCRMADFMRGVYQPMFERIARQVPDMAEEGRRYSVIPKINIYFRTLEDREKGYAELKALPLQLSFSEDATLEITPPGISKATGLKRLADHLNIPLGQTAAIGDNYNDTEMLAASGFSVAMGNAVPELLASCDHVTVDNDHNGVGAAIRFILEMNS